MCATALELKINPQREPWLLSFSFTESDLK